MTGELPPLPFEKRQSTRELTAEDWEQIVLFLGQGPVDFLAERHLHVQCQESQLPLIGLVRAYFFEVEGRVVELFYKGTKPTRVEVCYSFATDFYANSVNKYDHEGELTDLPQSMRFIQFMKSFLATFRPDAPLLFVASDAKRLKLINLLVQASNLQNVRKY